MKGTSFRSYITRAASTGGPALLSIEIFVQSLRWQGLKSQRENLKRSPEFGGSPLLQQRGATLQRCGEKLDFDKRFSAGFEKSRAKARLFGMNCFSAGLKSSSPLLKQGAPTSSRGGSRSLIQAQPFDGQEALVRSWKCLSTQAMKSAPRIFTSPKHSRNH
jgi:hypothetical protein